MGAELILSRPMKLFGVISVKLWHHVGRGDQKSNKRREEDVKDYLKTCWTIP